MSDNLDDLSIYEMFRLETEEQVEALQAKLLALQEGDTNEPTLRALMRSAHSLKGAARVVGLAEPVRLTHAMEERFVAAQQGHAISEAEVDTLLAAVDVLRSLTVVSENETAAWSSANDAAITQLVAELTSAPAELPEPEATPENSQEQTSAPPLAIEAVGDTSHDRRSADLNLRITSQRFDRIIALSSDTLVQAQGLTRLQEQVARLQLRLMRLVRSVVDAQRKTYQTPEKQAAALAVIIAQGDRDRARMGELLAELDRIVHQHEANCERLHHEVLHARLRPFGDIVPNLRRLVRDTAAEMGKSVQFIVTGERTEVDRDILEKLRAPLEHLLRNALDHGLEPTSTRIAGGKPGEGTIHLRARHVNGRLVIVLEDNGGGVDTAAVARRAIERGLVQRETASLLSDAEVLEFLFLPGFSTRTEVTEISGRGFGLDVVQSTVHESGGSVTIDNKPGQGTTFEMILPVTRSLLRVMRIEVENETYAVPLHRISRIASGTIEVDGAGATTAAIKLGNETARLPTMHMMTALHHAPVAQHAGPAMLLLFLNDKGKESPIAFQIDRVLDETTVAVRQLDPRLGRMAAIAAVTLNEQNVPLLIVEPDDILRLALQTQQREEAASPNEDAATRASILVVDDSATVRQMLRRTLSRAGYQVATAEHGVEAWNMMQTQSFDLLVSDVDMPEMNGIELVEHVRANTRLAHLPVIILSYKGREEDRKRGLDAGADAYVTKGEFQEQAFLQIALDLVGPAELPAQAGHAS